MEAKRSPIHIEELRMIRKDRWEAELDLMMDTMTRSGKYEGLLTKAIEGKVAVSRRVISSGTIVERFGEDKVFYVTWIEKGNPPPQAS